MDLYSLLSLQAVLLVPFVLFFLFFKKNEGRSLYSGRDIFYPVKLYLAKKVVKAAQVRSKKNREKLLINGSGPDIFFSSQQGTRCQNFSACDQKGNSLKLKFTLKLNKIAEVIMVLKLANGIIYTLPDSGRVRMAVTKENGWKINGLIIENLEPYRRLRIIYNGLLQNMSYRNYEQIEHVQFNFIFNCCSAPKFYPEDCDTNLIAETLATRLWKDASWKEFLKNHPNGYEQFGSLLGLVKGESLPEEQVLNLAACRMMYIGSDEKFLLDREIKIFLAETNGVLVNLTLRAFKDSQSQLSYGYIYHKKHITGPISSQDVRIKNIGENKILPELFIARVKINTDESKDEYTCVFNLNKLSAIHHTFKDSFEVFNTYAECDVNMSQGKALLEFCYYNQNADINLPNITPLLSGKTMDILPNNFVVNIKSSEAKILNLTGGKGNSLALLAALKSNQFLVPDGFVVTVNAFEKQLSENKLLQEAIRHIEDAFCGRGNAKREEVCASAVQLFKTESLDPDVAKYIIEALNDVKKDTVNDALDVLSWAVRSSAIGEDSEEISAAGQNETILGCVTVADILKAVTTCWASLFTYQSVQYRWQHGLPIKADMAVVVQKMVPAEAAGVLFTWHPTTSNPSQMVITSNFGLGESVVSGKSDPDTFILNRTYNGKVCLLEQVIGTKDKVLTLTEHGVKEVTISDGQEDSFVFINGKDATENWSLTPEQVLKLGKVGIQLEEAFGDPRDIEWAFYKGELYLLQSRPITTLNNWTDFELTHELDTVVVTENSFYSTANSGEVFPRAVSVLSSTTTLCNLERGLQLYINNQINPYFMQTLTTFQHRVLIDCILSVYILERKDEIQMATKVLDLAIFGHPVINKKINVMVRSRLGTLPRFYQLKQTFKHWKYSRKIKETVDKLTELAKNVDPGIRDDDDLETIYDKIVSLENGSGMATYYHAYSTNNSVFWQMICMMVLVGNEKELGMTHYTDFANILSSCEDVESAEVPLYLGKIAQIIKNEGYSEEFCTIKPELGLNWLQAKCPSAHEVLKEFLEKHGHRCLGEFDVIQETWGLNPSQVIPMIQANVKHMRNLIKEHRTIDQVIKDLKSPVNFVKKKILKYVLSNLRTAVGKREQSKSALILLVHKSRIAFRRLAAEMMREGLIPSEDLIFHLTIYELGEVIKKRNPVLINKAIRRKKLYCKWNNIKFPELNYGIPEPENEIFAQTELLPGSKCTGTPVCTGSAQARACVITNLEEIGSLEKGDILITYCTDIGWSPYFPMLSGIVTELGGLVSHGAVVAREYGLPCIVGIKNVTKMFKTGDIVYLSGKTGELGKVV